MTVSSFPNISALAIAARQGDTAKVLSQLEQGAEVDKASPCGWTALTDAARKGHSAIIRKLIGHGSDPNVAAHDGTTPLMLAALHGHTDAVDILLAAGANPNLESLNQCTAFEYAAQGGHPHIARRVHAAGAVVREHEAILYIRSVLASCGLRCTLLPARTRKPTRWAVDEPISLVPGDLLPVQHLILGESLTQPTLLERIEFCSGESFQHHPPALPPDVAGLPLPDPQWRYRNGWSEPAQAVLHGELPPDDPDSNGLLPLLEATRRGHAKLVQALLQAGANPNTRPKYGLMREATLLMNGAETGNSAVLETLLNAGADPDAQSRTGWTALMIASARGHLNAVQLLAHHTNALDAKNAQGQNALQLAVDKGFPQVARALIRAQNQQGIPKKTGQPGKGTDPSSKP